MKLWLERYRASAMRLPRKFDDAELQGQLAAILDTLAAFLSPGRDGRMGNTAFLPGSSALRELEKSVSFVAATQAGSGASSFDVAALVFSLRDVLGELVEGAEREVLWHYMEWLAVLASDSLGTARVMAAQERFREELDHGIQVVLLTPELPAVLFVGRPEPTVVASIFGRLLLTVVRVAARAVIIDVMGVSGKTEGPILAAFERFVGHPKIAGRATVVLRGVTRDEEALWTHVAQSAKTRLILEPTHFDEAVAQALQASSARLVTST